MWRESYVHFEGKAITIQWNRGHGQVTFGSKSSYVDETEVRKEVSLVQRRWFEQLSDLAEANKWPSWLKKLLNRITRQLLTFKRCRVKQQMTRVYVRRYITDWYQADEKVLYKLLGEEDDELEIFGDTFICDFLNAKNLTRQLLPFGFAPYVLYTCSSVFYFVQRLGKDKSDGSLIMGVSTACIVWLLLLEVVQLYSLKFNIFKYLGDGWNMLLMASYVLTLYIFSLERQGSYTETEGEIIPIVTSIDGFLIIQGLFYWSQMFGKVAMYKRIIMESVIESRYFMIMVFFILANFGLAIYSLDQTQQMIHGKQIDFPEYVEYTQDRFGHEIIDSFLSVYLLMLGDFDMTSNPVEDAMATYGQKPQILFWIYFVAATFVAQVVFLNVLVAVIGQSYDEKWSNRDKYAIQQKTIIFSDYIMMMKTRITLKPFLYVVQPANDEEVKEIKPAENDAIKLLADTKAELKVMLQNQLELDQERNQKLDKLLELLQEKVGR